VVRGPWYFTQVVDKQLTTDHWLLTNPIMPTDVETLERLARARDFIDPKPFFAITRETGSASLNLLSEI